MQAHSQAPGEQDIHLKQNAFSSQIRVPHSEEDKRQSPGSFMGDREGGPWQSYQLAWLQAKLTLTSKSLKETCLLLLPRAPGLTWLSRAKGPWSGMLPYTMLSGIACRFWLCPSAQNCFCFLVPFHLHPFLSSSSCEPRPTETSTHTKLYERIRA